MEQAGVKLTTMPVTTLLLKQQNQVNTVQKKHPYKHSKRGLPEVIQTWA